MGQGDQGLGKAGERYGVIPRTLCFIMRGDELLLLKGAPHKRIWAGKYNGVGGHVEAGEDVSSAAVREIVEETGMEIDDLRLRGIVHVDAGDQSRGILLFVYTARTNARASGTCADGELVWFPVNALPAEGMVEDLPVLLPRLLAMGEHDAPFSALYRYDEHDRLQVLFGPTG